MIGVEGFLGRDETRPGCLTQESPFRRVSVFPGVIQWGRRGEGRHVYRRPSVHYKIKSLRSPPLLRFRRSYRRREEVLSGPRTDRRPSEVVRPRDRWWLGLPGPDPLFPPGAPPKNNGRLPALRRSCRPGAPVDTKDVPPKSVSPGLGHVSRLSPRPTLPSRTPHHLFGTTGDCTRAPR